MKSGEGGKAKGRSKGDDSCLHGVDDVKLIPPKKCLFHYGGINPENLRRNVPEGDRRRHAPHFRRRNRVGSRRRGLSADCFSSSERSPDAVGTESKGLQPLDFASLRSGLFPRLRSGQARSRGEDFLSAFIGAYRRFPFSCGDDALRGFTSRTPILTATRRRL
jgi:hypothetical protein